MEENELQDKIRYQINKWIFENGFAPNVNEISKEQNISEEETKKGLNLLAENHALVLHPNSHEIWVAHPFALFPTLFYVKTSSKNEWYSNCAWCSLGVAALTLNQNLKTEIFTKIAGEETPITIHINEEGEIIEKNFVVHFAIPAKKLWENVIYTCSMMLIFRNENEVDEWCKKYNKEKGEVKEIGKVWELAKIWYGDYLSVNFKRKTKEIAQEMFSRVDFTSDFWQL